MQDFMQPSMGGNKNDDIGDWRCSNARVSNAQSRLANYIMFFESNQYEYNQRDVSRIDFSHGDDEEINSTSSSGFIVLHTESLMNCSGDSNRIPLVTTAKTKLSVLPSATLTPKPAPRTSLVNQARAEFKSSLITTNRVATLKRELFSTKSQSAQFQRSLPGREKELSYLINKFPTKQLNQQLKNNQGNKNDKTIKDQDNVPRSQYAHQRILSPPGIYDEETKEASSSSEHDDNDGDNDDDGATTEDSTDNKPNNKPKPGRLDLKQFDNITSAIGKLTTSSTSTPLVAGSSSSTRKNLTDSQTSNTKRLNNPRQNHGRAVAPPKLPPNMSYKNSTDNINPPLRDQSTPTSKYADSSSKEKAIDFSQSPIAQRLLKHSKNHKVSELNSPYESETELQQSNKPTSKTQELLKGYHKEELASSRNNSVDSSDLMNSRGETIRQLNEILAKKPSPGYPTNSARINRGSSLDVPPSETVGSDQTNTSKGINKKDRKKMRSDEKMEKRKIKEEERLRRQEEEKQRRQEKKLAAKKSKSNLLNPDSVDEDGIPLFIKRCVEFIEAEGLDAEGIYRVPGNRAHVDTFVQKFKENPSMSILESDIPVNAVATALKDFLSKKWGPIIPPSQIDELTAASSISDVERRVDAIKIIVKKLPDVNYNLLKYLFSHFGKVKQNQHKTSMTSENLSIVWWPTLLPIEFNDMSYFEQMRPHLEWSVQILIEKFDYIFDESSH